MSLNGKFLDKDHLQYFWQQIKLKFATAAQGTKADTALQQSDVSSTYSASGTAPVNGTAVSDALGTLNKSSVGGSGKYISAISEVNGKIEATPTTFDTSLSSYSTDNNAPTSKAVYDDQKRQQSEIDYAINTGVKNLLVDQASTGITTGITYTHNSDGTITASGTASASGWHILSQSNTLKKGRYILSGGYSGAATCIVSQTLSLSDAIAVSSGDEIEFELSADTQGLYYALRTQSGTTLNNAVFKPMLRSASITDSTFVPYALPNPTLTPAAIKAVDEGAKNLSPQADGSSSSSWVDFGIDIPAGDYVLSFTSLTSTDTDGSTIQVAFFDANDSATYIQVPRGSNVSKRFTTLSARVRCRVYRADSHAHGSGDTMTFTGCMICTAADWAVSQKFVPYRPSWQEMAEKTAQIGLKLVKSQTVRSNTEVTYAMNKNDFLESSPILEGSIGTYVISVMPWSLTPTFSLYTVSYTGGSFAYTSIVKIAGADRTVTVSDGIISVSGFPSAGAKVSIHAML